MRIEIKEINTDVVQLVRTSDFDSGNLGSSPNICAK